MKPRVQITAIALAVAAVALIAAGCGSSNNDSSSSDSSNSSSSSPGRYGGSTTPAADTGGAATVSLAKAKMGQILVGKNGRTLYLFEGDKGGKPSCSGACAAAWPPFTVKGQPQAGSGLTASKLSTARRSDGALQVVYAGHPLYYYAGDTTAGQTNGQGLDQFGAEWYVVGPSGHTVEGGES
jgi:predicted lipoprotein with Yx(FWY)xxD motif